MHPTPKDAVNLWTAGFATSAVIQGLGLRWFARMAKWGYNDGWQREIAIWNRHPHADRRPPAWRCRGACLGRRAVATVLAELTPPSAWLRQRRQRN